MPCVVLGAWAGTPKTVEATDTDHFRREREFGSGLNRTGVEFERR